MDHQIEPSKLDALIAKDRLGVITGLGGTIAPVAEGTQGEPPTAGCREALDKLCEVTSLVAVLSARPAVEIHGLVDLPDVVYSGIRGLETWSGGRLDFAPEVESYRHALEAAMSDLYTVLDSNTQMEDAGSALFVNLPPETADSDFNVLAARVMDIANKHHLRYYQGLHVLEIRPPMVLNKGTALERLASSYHLDGVIYLGNDLSDVDAFRAVRSLRKQGLCDGLNVGVLNHWTASEIGQTADEMVKGLVGVEEFLDHLYRERRAWLDREASVM